MQPCLSLCYGQWMCTGGSTACPRRGSCGSSAATLRWSSSGWRRLSSAAGASPVTTTSTWMSTLLTCQSATKRRPTRIRWVSSSSTKQDAVVDTEFVAGKGNWKRILFQINIVNTHRKEAMAFLLSLCKWKTLINSSPIILYFWSKIESPKFPLHLLSCCDWMIFIKCNILIQQYPASSVANFSTVICVP